MTFLKLSLLGMRLRCSCCFLLSKYSAFQKSLKNHLMSGCILRLHPPTHWTQFALCLSARIYVCLHSHALCKFIGIYLK